MQEIKLRSHVGDDGILPELKREHESHHLLRDG